MEAVKPHDISGESFRTYRYFLTGEKEPVNSVTIAGPVTLFCAMGHAFHRVWDGVTVHLCHSPGPIRNIDGDIVGWCVISWVPVDDKEPVKF